MAERGVIVDHATVHRWALKILPVLTAVFRRRKCPPLTSSTRSPSDLKSDIWLRLARRPYSDTT